MQLISRISVRRYEMGEAGHASGHGPATSLAIFRVLGQSTERALRLLAAEMARAADPVIVLAIDGEAPSDEQKAICSSALTEGIRKSTKIVFCGGDPARIFGRVLAGSTALSWFPTVKACISSYENGGHRQSAAQPG